MVSIFCLNFVGLYTATSLVPSGLVSVVFSPASIFNAVNARVFFSDPISRQTVLAGGLGVAGLGVTPMIANAWGTGIGAFCLLGLLSLTGQPLILPHGGPTGRRWSISWSRARSWASPRI